MSPTYSTRTKRGAGARLSGDEEIGILGAPGADAMMVLKIVSGGGTNVAGSPRQNVYGTSGRVWKSNEPVLLTNIVAVKPATNMTTAATGSCLLKILDRLSELSDLEENWDSYGAEILDSTALETARALVLRLYGDFGDPGVPTVAMPLAHGGVQLEWDSPTGALEVSMDREGSLRLLSGTGEAAHLEYQEFEGVDPSEVAGFLNKVLGT